MASRFTVRGEAADSVAEYLRYRQIVGDADGGVPFTEKEYEEFKAKRGIVDGGPARAVGPAQPSAAEVMAIYEQRYQARRKAEKARLRPGERERPKYGIALNMPPMHLLDLANGVYDESNGSAPVLAPRMPWDIDYNSDGDRCQSAVASTECGGHARPDDDRGSKVAPPSRRGAPSTRSARLPTSTASGTTRNGPGRVAAVGDRVVVSSARNGRAVERGTLMFLGETSFASGLWAGIELDLPDGKNDGQVDGTRYFHCAPQHGIFVKPSRVSVDPRVQ